MSDPTRCVTHTAADASSSAQACLFIDTAGDGTACNQATYQGATCQSCLYVAQGLCTTTTAGYQLDCRNIAPAYSDMIICGNTLSARPASDDDSGINMVALIFFIVLFCLSMGVRAYAEVVRWKKGLEDDNDENTKKDAQQDSDNKKKNKNKSRDLQDMEEGNGQKKKNGKTAKPEESLNKNNSNSKKGSTDGPATKQGSSSKPSASTTSNHSKKSTNSRDSTGKKKNPSSSSSSSSKDLKKSSSKKTTKKASSSSSAQQPPSPSFEFDNIAWDDFDDGFDTSDKKAKDQGSVDSQLILPGDKFEPYNQVKGDAKAAALKKYHKKGDWEAIRDFFHKIRRRIIERQHYVGLLVEWIAADWPGPVHADTIFCKYLDEWSEAEPDNLQCNVIRLEVWIAWAWHGRTTAFAHEISPDRVELFYDRMDRGAAELERVLKVSKKNDALIYAAAMKIATGRNDEQAVVQEYMEAVQSSNDPANYNFHVRAMDYFTEKWHGSHQEMMDYAKWITGQLPDGHPLWILIPMAHYEVAVLLESAGERMTYWHKQHDEIIQAYEKALGGPWETTVNQEVSPACQKLDAVVRNWFVYALGKCRATELAQRQARVIGKRPLAELPWDEKNTYIRHVKNLGFVVD